MEVVEKRANLYERPYVKYIFHCTEFCGIRYC